MVEEYDLREYCHEWLKIVELDIIKYDALIS